MIWNHVTYSTFFWHVCRRGHRWERDVTAGSGLRPVQQLDADVAVVRFMAEAPDHRSPAAILLPAVFTVLETSIQEHPGDAGPELPVDTTPVDT